MNRLRLMVALLPLVLAGCDQSSSIDTETKLPTTTMRIAGQTFVLEKAVTVGQQEVGLMRRDSMAADHGMIFPFAKTTSETFWNHDVRFPLDIIFLDGNGQVVSIQRMEPYDETPTQAVPMRYAVELNAGTAVKIGLKVGDQLTLPPDVALP